MSTRITSGMVQRNVLADLNAVSGRLTQTQTKIASNKQITRPSDDPFNTARALALRESLDSTKQYQANVDDAKGWQETSEVAFNSMTGDVQTAREALVQGGTGSMDPASRNTIASQIDQLIVGLKETANATYKGRYIFSGTKSDQVPYPIPEPAPPATDVFQGSPAQVARQIGPGVTIDVSVSAAGVLGDGQGAANPGLIGTLRDIADHLRSGDDVSLRGSDLTKLDAGLDSLLAVRALNGSREQRLDGATDRLGQIEESTLTQLSNTEDVDIAKAMIDFSSQQAAYQSALKAGATIVQNSLMDFLR
jgi:flagellar hook-associated protein 3 FlgL